jgi:hypothetical protein
VVVTYVLLAMASILIYALFWIPGGLRKQWRRPAERAIRIWPLIAVLSLIGFVVVLQLASIQDAIALLGNFTGWSLALLLATVLFAVASIASAVALWRARQADIRGGIRWYSIAVTLALLITTAYLSYWGIIGLRTWA